jgi:RNA polymerase sigma factor (sigma-70 family)
MTDKDLLERISSGDRRAGAELVRRHADRSFGLALRILRNREDAEEAMQDAFVRVFRSVEQFEGKSSFTTWLYRIVYNVCMSIVQRRGSGNLSPAIEEPMFEIAAIDDSMPNRVAESAEFDLIVRREIESLPADQALVLTLFLLNEQSYNKIVAITGLPLGTVKNRLFRARLRLRDAVMLRYRIPESITETA